MDNKRFYFRLVDNRNSDSDIHPLVGKAKPRKKRGYIFKLWPKVMISVGYGPEISKVDTMLSINWLNWTLVVEYIRKSRYNMENTKWDG